MNPDDERIKKAILDEIDTQDFDEARAVLGFLSLSEHDKRIAITRYQLIIAKHQPPAQPKDYEGEG